MTATAQIEYSLSDREFQLFRDLLYQESGISLSDSKNSLVLSRLTKRLRQLGLNSFTEYYDYVKGDQGAEELITMLDRLSTNKTDFFREPAHFKFLADKILPKHREKRSLTVWCAAASSGEEPYTIAMTLYDGVQNPAEWRFRILASDLSTRVLKTASSGVYEMDRVRGLKKPLLKRHFLKGTGGNSGKVRVKPYLLEMLLFRRINLMDECFPIKTPLDVIFCRNVMIYFDKPTQERLIHKFYRYLRPGGHLFIGHSESLQFLDHPFSLVSGTTYQKPEA